LPQEQDQDVLPEDQPTYEGNGAVGEGFSMDMGVDAQTEEDLMGFGLFPCGYFHFEVDEVTWDDGKNVDGNLVKTPVLIFACRALAGAPEPVDADENLWLNKLQWARFYPTQKNGQPNDFARKQLELWAIRLGLKKLNEKKTIKWFTPNSDAPEHGLQQGSSPAQGRQFIGQIEHREFDNPKTNQAETRSGFAEREPIFRLSDPDMADVPKDLDAATHAGYKNLPKPGQDDGTV
jgi:hypothetical protein